LLYEIAQWRVPVANSKKHVEFWEEHSAYQRSHREKFHYKRSRILKMNDSETSREETWMWIDEYENQEAYDKMNKAFSDDPELSSIGNRPIPELKLCSFRDRVRRSFGLSTSG